MTARRTRSDAVRPPCSENRNRLVVGQRAVPAFVIEKHRKGLANGRATGNTEELHHVGSVEVRPFLGPFFLGRKCAYAHFQFVDPLMKGGDFVRVAGKDRDTLQDVIAFLGSKDFGVELQYTNYRSN